MVTRPTPRDSDPPRTTTTAKLTAPKPVNPYAKPSAPMCYRCGLPGHKSNECSNRRTIGLVDDEEYGDEEEEYEGADFVEEDFKEEKTDNEKNLFQSYCSINKKICNLIIDNGCCENLVAQKLIDHLGVTLIFQNLNFSLK
ncbi:hypothetical protein OSB04_007718 [Centaurea solstitialis]|uniref:CCHC-type domain-containing protein n=1 Tax=Centaurea solstitialis TaxID=347529 RepID=A0AA38TKE7_9ASTR|nr:hypothetical protein OSB04_007718 [Centaurea solstitialis]